MIAIEKEYMKWIINLPSSFFNFAFHLFPSQFCRYRKPKNQISDQTPDVPGTSSRLDNGSSVNHVKNGKTITADGVSISSKGRFKSTAQGVVNSVRVIKGVQEGLASRVVLTDDNKSISTCDNKSLNSVIREQPTPGQVSFGMDDDQSQLTLPFEGDKVGGTGFGEDVMDGDKIETATADVIVNEYPADCFPDKWYDKCPGCLEETPFMLKWKELRYHSYNLVENKYFETVCITLILLSSMTLALEDVHLKERKWLIDSLVYIDKFFTIIFLFEMLLKWFAYGFKAYFSNAWCWLDFVIVMVSNFFRIVLFFFFIAAVMFASDWIQSTMSIMRTRYWPPRVEMNNTHQVSIINLFVSYLGFGNVPAFKTMRTLRALRPLRAMSRLEGMRVSSSPSKPNIPQS